MSRGTERACLARGQSIRRARRESNGFAVAAATSGLRLGFRLGFILCFRRGSGLLFFLILIRLGPVVGHVEPAPLEDHPRSRADQTPQLAAAFRAALPRGIGHLLEDLE